MSQWIRAAELVASHGKCSCCVAMTDAECSRQNYDDFETLFRPKDATAFWWGYPGCPTFATDSATRAVELTAAQACTARILALLLMHEMGQS